MAHTPQSILKTVFGYDDFRPLQAEIIDSVLNKNDTLSSGQFTNLNSLILIKFKAI